LGWLLKDTFPTIKLKGSECTILTVLGTHLLIKRRIKNLFYLAGVVLSSLKRGMPITFNLAI
jgi:hypothetical protein